MPEATGGTSGAAGHAGSGNENETGGVAGESGAAGAAGEPGEHPLVLGGLEVSSTPADLPIDLFGVAGHRFWFEVSEEQVTLMNDGLYGGGWYGGGDIYTPGGSADTTYADHVLVEDFTTKRVADHGQLEVKLVGESTGRQWTESSIPNLRIDTDELQDGMRIGTTEHLRLNNSLVGSIFREHIAHRIYRELGYPALRSSFAFLGSSVWGEDVWVPMTLIEVYKCRTMEDREDVVGGACLNMWEFAGDVAYDIPDDACQNKECDDTRLEELSDALNTTPNGPGFMDALADYIDWDMYHKFQCLSWIMWTGDDPLHNANNNLIIEREDHRMVWAPYSVDISAGQEWYQNTPLTGFSSIPTGCQSDPACWEETMETCAELIADFQALQPETIVDETVALLDGLGMMRRGDEERAETLRDWFVQRQLDLPTELEMYRVLPDEFGNCPDGLERCENGACGTSEQCSLACGNGYEWCSVYGYCVDPQWDQCPDCSGDTPVWCPMLGSCVATQDDCFVECQDGLVYCEMFGECARPEDCYGYWEE